ncbi:hypothetical protein [Collimonas pratensis]|uniref:hypothetical protein n=1 Tax=Collimonas pratensis TaxID=279113 RepID=UPI000AB8CB9F|nr:hypothetical protein [Collimonas pratensis]
MDFVEVVYKRLEDRWIKTQDYVDWATQLFDEGCAAPSIAELASCSLEAHPDAQQVECLFQACVLELGLTLTSNWYDALLAYTSSICKKMLLGTLQPWAGMQEMLTLSDDNNEPYILWIWVDLARDISNGHAKSSAHIIFNDALRLDNPDECIRRTALQFVALCTIPLPHKFPLIWWCKKCDAVSDENTFTDTKTHMCPKCGATSSMKNMRFFEHRDACSANGSHANDV